MAWLILVLAGLFEIVWAAALRASEGFSKPGATVLTVVALVISMLLLGLSLRTIPLGTAYAVWTGIGAVGAVGVGIIVYNEPLTAARVTCLVLIICGIAGLKLLTPS